MQTSNYTLFNGVTIEVLELQLTNMEGEPLDQIMIAKKEDYDNHLDGNTTDEAEHDDNQFYCYVTTNGKTFAELLSTVKGRQHIKDEILQCDAMVVEDEPDMDDSHDHIYPQLPEGHVLKFMCQYTTTQDGKTSTVAPNQATMASVYACMLDGTEIIVAEFKDFPMAFAMCSLLNQTLNLHVNAIMDNGFITVDVNATELPRQLVDSLKYKETYVDQSDLQEHLYSEEIGEELPSWANELKPIVDKMNLYKAAYFRLIPQPIPGKETL